MDIYRVATIALFLGALSLVGSILVFLGQIPSPGEWWIVLLALAALILGFAERRKTQGKIGIALALLAVLPGLALIGWLRLTVTG
ncbi:MAG TPA: hypothetical protein VGC86_03670 [Afipia sp.]